jgi:phage protein D
MVDSRSSQLRARPAFAISIDGTALPLATMLSLSAISVDEDAGVPSMFTLELTGGDGDDETGWIDGDQFAVGAAVTIALGHGEDLGDLIDGEVTALEPVFARGRRPRLTVRGYDRRHRLLRGRRTRSFVQQKDSDIAATIAGEAGLSAETEDSEVVHDYLLQANQTDLEFLDGRARRIEYELVVAGRTLHFRPVQNQQGETLTLTLQDDLLEFAPRLSTMGQFSALELRGWSAKDRQAIVATAGSGDAVSTMGGSDSGAALTEAAFGASTLLIGDQPVLNQAEADQLARACFNRGLLRLIRGDGICRGRADLHPGQVIRIDGIGTRFSGQYYVSATCHRYAPDQPYRTHFTVARNAA